MDSKIGVLLTNLGTPELPTPRAIWRYLAEFLSDPKVIELPKVFWYPLLYGVILPLRLRKVTHAYRSVWTPHGSPLLDFTQRQAAVLQQRLGKSYCVVVGMRYGTPSLKQAWTQLQHNHIEQLIVLPLYPQFSATTTGSTFNELMRVLMPMRRVPSLHFVSEYYQSSFYIKALAASVRHHWQRYGRAEVLVISFHGLPQSYVERGDPYYQQCLATAEALAEQLQLSALQYRVCFQSRVGRQPWLQPYTDLLLSELASQGISSVQVMCPGFSADCLETLEEVSIRYRQLFLAAGGRHFEYIPALNDQPDHIEMMADLIYSCGRQ